MLTNSQRKTLTTIDSYIYNQMSDESTGHDYYHIKRVVNLTSRLISNENNAFVCLSIAYLHDLFDDKINPVDNLNNAFNELFDSLDLDMEGYEDQIIEGVKEIGFKGGFGVKDKSCNASVVSDADLLDAMGAVGIARTFYYAGAKGTPLYDPKLDSVTIDSVETYRNAKRNAIDHFDEKLLQLKDWIVTPKGKALALRRHKILEDFYYEFHEEIKE